MSKLLSVLSQKELAICGLDDLDEYDQRELYVAIKNSAGRRVLVTKRHRFFGHGGPMLENDFHNYLDYLLRYYPPGDERREALKAEIMAHTIQIHQCLIDRALRNIWKI